MADDLIALADQIARRHQGFPTVECWYAYCDEMARQGFQMEWNGPTPGSPEWHQQNPPKAQREMWGRAYRRLVEQFRYLTKIRKQGWDWR